MIDRDVYRLAREPKTERLLRQFWTAKDEDRPALARCILVAQPGLVVSLLAAAVPHLVPFDGEGEPWPTAAMTA